MMSSSGIYTLLIWSMAVVSVIGGCEPGKKTNDRQGRCCVFPFTYGGKTFDSCTTYANGNTPWCSFDTVYVGKWANCVNSCTNQPCKNGGTCTVTGEDTYSCQCAEGYYGDSCEKVSPCNTSPCKNGATCTMTGEDTYSCTCTEEFEGDTCESRRPCPPGKKTNDAQGRCCVFPFTYGGKTFDSCTTYGNGNTPWCSFDTVYVGKWANCVNSCTNQPCKNGGTCTVTGEGTYSCKCAEGYYGDSCEKVSPCNTSPCKNGATCTMTGEDTYSCTCTEEFEGDTCESRRPCPPGKKTNDAQGRCCVFPFTYGGKTFDSCTTYANGNTPWCSFDAVYVGKWANCVDECASSPCKNGASCKATADGYSCQPCPAGWKGKNCDEDINECESSPCKNGAECVNQAKGYSCKCKDGYTGEHCEQDINECANDPCVNGGTCHDEVGQYTCECAAGYEGTNCETDIDECKDNPCKNGGACVNSPPGSYTCKCAEGYQGDHCQEVKWNSEGCFNEHKKQSKKALGYKFATIKGVDNDNPDIEKVFHMCRVAAEQEGYEIFAIRGVNRCITSSDGKPVDFKLYGASSNCKTNEQGHGVGKEATNFVYTR